MVIEKVNALTKRWSAAVGADPGSPPRSTVLSGAGVWPLLAFLADGADDAGRAELAAAIGVTAEEAAAAARAVLTTVERSGAARVALGLWTRRQVRVREAWLAELASGVHGELTGDVPADQQRLDAWASEHTDGLIPRLPLKITDASMMVLASALAVEVTWRERFTAGRVQAGGVWADARGELSGLRLTTTDQRMLRVADTAIGRVSALTVVGDADVDVVLVLGPQERSAAEVMAVGVELAGLASPEGSGATSRHTNARTDTEAGADANPVRSVVFGPDLPADLTAPGVSTDTVTSPWPADLLAITTIPFRIEARHDLLDHAELFGLSHVTTKGHGHFPGISDFPLAVDRAAQDAVAEFTATGFHAAAVTAFDAVGAGMPPPPRRVRRVSVVFNRPFAYYAVHRPSGLILVAGWVSEPSYDVSSGRA